MVHYIHFVFRNANNVSLFLVFIVSGWTSTIALECAICFNVPQVFMFASLSLHCDLANSLLALRLTSGYSVGGCFYPYFRLQRFCLLPDAGISFSLLFWAFYSFIPFKGFLHVHIFSHKKNGGTEKDISHSKIIFSAVLTVHYRGFRPNYEGSLERMASHLDSPISTQ